MRMTVILIAIMVMIVKMVHVYSMIVCKALEVQESVTES